MIRDDVAAALKRAIAEMAGDTMPSPRIEVPENPVHGDYASNAALVLAKLLKRPPRDIAEEIASLVNRQAKGAFRASVAPPGFINISIGAAVFERALRALLRARALWGKRKASRGNIQVEFVSANPTGPLTLANGRGGFFGDALANVLDARGWKVEREYYINDTGRQIITLGKSLLAAEGLIPEEESFYKGEYIRDWARGHKTIAAKYAHDPLRLGKRAAKDFLRSIKKTLRAARIRFDRYTSEDAHIHAKGFVEKALLRLRSSGHVYESEGATWLATSVFGDDKDRVLITSDGFPTYFFADTGHYLETVTRGFGAKVNIVGPDHYGYVARIQAASRILGLKRSEVLVTQAVRLMRDGEEVKMSKRRGEFITFQELMEEVPLDGARFFFLMHSLDTHMDFDLTLAKERSVKNPVYYVQYAHARMVRLLEHAKKEKIKLSLPDNGISLLASPEERHLLSLVLRLPEVLEDVAEDFRVNRIANWTLHLARQFHDFYERHRIIGEEPRLAAARLALVRATLIVLGEALHIMGVSAPKRM